MYPGDHDDGPKSSEKMSKVLAEKIPKQPTSFFPFGGICYKLLRTKTKTRATTPTTTKTVFTYFCYEFRWLRGGPTGLAPLAEKLAPGVANETQVLRC